MLVNLIQSVEGLKRKEEIQKPQDSLDSTLQQQPLPEFPGCQVALQSLNLPAPTTAWPNSLKSISLYLYI